MTTRTLDGKSAIISGANGAMAKATAQLLANDGAALVLTARREDVLEETRQAILEQAPGARVDLFLADACDEASVKASLVHAHKLHGEIDIIVSTVGSGGRFAPLLLLERDDFIQQLERNVLSAFYLIKHGVPLMREGGAIACISSTTSSRPMAGYGHYCAAKAGLDMLVKVASEELATANIRINAVRAGVTRSAASSPMLADPGLHERIVTEIPLGRVGDPTDVAAALRFLVGPETSWVTGQSFAVDGGTDLRRVPDFGDLLDKVHGKEAMAQIRAGKLPQAVAS